MKPERLREVLDYDPLSGRILNKKTRRLLQPDHDGLVIIFDSATKRSIKMKLDRIAYAMAFGALPKDDKRVLHKNLNTEDNRLCNLRLVSRALFLQIKEAHKNLTTGIKMVAHPVDQFCYIVHWFEDGAEKTRIFQDVVPARAELLKLQLRYSKVLTKYCVFDDLT